MPTSTPTNLTTSPHFPTSSISHSVTSKLNSERSPMLSAAPLAAIPLCATLLRNVSAFSFAMKLLQSVSVSARLTMGYCRPVPSCVRFIALVAACWMRFLKAAQFPGFGCWRRLHVCHIFRIRVVCIYWQRWAGFAHLRL